jgi:bacterioferritin
VETTWDAAIGAPHDSSAHTRACVPGASRAFTNTALSPCQASVASGRTSTSTCALLTDEDWANPSVANNNPIQIALFNMIERSPNYTCLFPRRNKRLDRVGCGYDQYFEEPPRNFLQTRASNRCTTRENSMSNNNQPFLTDVKELRARARANIDKGAVTPAYQGDVKQTIEILQSVLATEIVCVLRYTMNAVAATGLSSESVKEEFDQHAKEEQGHMRSVAERINQLGGTPNFNPEGLATRSASQYSEGATLVEMIKENLVAERIACEHYRELIRYFADKDPTTRVMMEGILVNEEEHANDMHDLLVAHEGKPMLSHKA